MGRSGCSYVSCAFPLPPFFVIVLGSRWDTRIFFRFFFLWYPACLTSSHYSLILSQTRHVMAVHVCMFVCVCVRMCVCVCVCVCSFMYIHSSTPIMCTNVNA